MKSRTRVKFEKHNRNVKKMRNRIHVIYEKLTGKGVVIKDENDIRSVIEAGRKYIGIKSTKVPETFSELKSMLNTIEVMLRAKAADALEPSDAKSEDTEQKPTKWQEVYYEPERKKDGSRIKGDKVAKFYASYEWRRARYATLKRYGFKCLACGRSAKQGAVIQVDHKKPLRYNWELRLDLDNLQPLCDWCNHGKGNWDKTDFTVG